MAPGALKGAAPYAAGRPQRRVECKAFDPGGRAMNRLLAACAALALGACAANPGAPPASAMDAAVAQIRHDVFPPACTVPAAVSGHDYFSISAFGSIAAGQFTLAQPSSWTEVEWLKIPPPEASRHAATTPNGYVEYWGTYRVGNGTSGCLYVSARSGGGRAAVTAVPRIPPKGATLPVDFGKLSSLTLTLDAKGSGTGQATLVREDGSAKATATLTIVGAVPH